MGGMKGWAAFANPRHRVKQKKSCKDCDKAKSSSRVPSSGEKRRTNLKNGEGGEGLARIGNWAWLGLEPASSGTVIHSIDVFGLLRATRGNTQADPEDAKL